MRRLQDAQNEWARDLIERARDIELDLEVREGVAHNEAVEAASAFNLSGAYQHWGTYHATRGARAHIRMAVQSAAERLQIKPPFKAELRLIRSSFQEWLDTQHNGIENLRQSIVAEHLTAQPTSLEEITAK